jgi:hypothetical protein
MFLANAQLVSTAQVETDLHLRPYVLQVITVLKGQLRSMSVTIRKSTKINKVNQVARRVKLVTIVLRMKGSSVNHIGLVYPSIVMVLRAPTSYAAMGRIIQLMVLRVLLIANHALLDIFAPIKMESRKSSPAPWVSIVSEVLVLRRVNLAQ